MWCWSGPTPVAIDAAHVGVTLGKAATQSSTYAPRSMTARSVGARPVATARSSIDGFRPSITARTTLDLTGWPGARPARSLAPRSWMPGADRAIGTVAKPRADQAGGDPAPRGAVSRVRGSWNQPSLQAQPAHAHLVEADVVGELVAHRARDLVAQQLRVVAEVAAQGVAEDHDPVVGIVTGRGVAHVEPVRAVAAPLVGDDHRHVLERV